MWTCSTLIQRIACLSLMCALGPASAESLRFYGYGTNDIDRVKIRVDDPSTNNPGPPADVGDTDFTIEFWIRAASGNNAATVPCGSGQYSWISGNTIIDRDRYDQGRSFGIALAGGRIAFGVRNGSEASHTLCSTSDLRDNRWHHIAVQRHSDGVLDLYIDGNRQATANGPTGTVSYPDNGQPLNRCGAGGNQSCANSDPFLVVGAEKHDVAPAYPSFSGWLTELRISSERRYSTTIFTVPTTRFVVDDATAALYHFTEGQGTAIIDATPGNQSPGVRRVGGGPPSGPEWSSLSPFADSPGAGQFEFAAQTYQVSEATPTLTIGIERVGGSTGIASVDYAIVGGSATQNADFRMTPVRQTWSEGEAGVKNISIELVDDFEIETSETILLELRNASGASLGSVTSVEVTITDNDSASPPPTTPPPTTPPPTTPPPTTPPAPNPPPSGGGGGGPMSALFGLCLFALRFGRPVTGAIRCACIKHK